MSIPPSLQYKESPSGIHFLTTKSTATLSSTPQFFSQVTALKGTQSDPNNTDTEGATISVYINGVSPLLFSLECQWGDQRAATN